MRRWTAIGVAAALVAVAWWLWPTEVRRVRARLATLAAAASVPPGDTELDRVTRLATLGRGLAPDISIEGPDQGHTIAGREAVVGLVSRFGAAAGPASIDLTDIEVTIDERGSSAWATAVVRVTTTSRDEVRQLDGKVVRFELAKIAGEWLVARAAPERALTRPQVR
jgi:SnoaL-like domain